MDQAFPVVVKHTIKTSTIVKVVVVGTVAAYFARNVVKAIDDTVSNIMALQKEEPAK